MPKTIFSLLDQIRAIAAEGLAYTKDPYDRDRYTQLMELVACEYESRANLSKAEVGDLLRRDLGCVTPKLGVVVVLFGKDDRLLVLQRSDDQQWCLPCGWVDVGETAADAAIREVREETGLEIKTCGYVDVFFKGPDMYPGIVHQVNIVVVGEMSVEDDVVIGHEHISFDWITEAERVTKEWHAGHEQCARAAFCEPRVRWAATKECAS